MVVEKFSVNPLSVEGSSKQQLDAVDMTHAMIRKNTSKETRSKISKLSKQRALRSVWLYLKVYIAIFFIVAISLYANNMYITILAVLLIAGRQHSLYILNHDASHSGLFQTKNTNKTVASIFSNFVMFHHPEAWSYVQWRRVHMSHHKHLFSNMDPNYVSRQDKGDTIASPSLTRLAWAVFSGGLLSLKDLLVGRQRYARPKDYKISAKRLRHLIDLFLPYKDDDEMERERILKLVFFGFSISLVMFLNIGYEFLIYWILPMYTVYPMILRFHDLTEHCWEVETNALCLNTRSREDGFLAKIFLTSLPRGFHREHHVYPRVNVVDLPIVNKLLVREGLVSEPTMGILGLLRELYYLNKYKVASLKH